MNARQLSGLANALRTTLQALINGDEPGSASARARRPIILIHGFGSTSANLEILARHLDLHLGRPVVRLSLGKRLPLHVQDIRVSAKRIHAALEQLADHAEFEYADIVGHSMGGLVAAYLLKYLDRGRHIRRVVTVGTPHQGAPLAPLGLLFFGALTRAVWQMLPGCTFLRELDSLPVPETSEIIALSSDEDIVVPTPFACVTAGPRQQNGPPLATTHWELVEAPMALACIAALLGGAAVAEALRAAA